MTHREQVLEKALENLLGRIARGQEFPDAQWAVTQLYGVNADDLRDAYDDFCCVKR
jgi:hypothetical protein